MGSVLLLLFLLSTPKTHADPIKIRAWTDVGYQVCGHRQKDEFQGMLHAHISLFAEVPKPEKGDLIAIIAGDQGALFSAEVGVVRVDAPVGEGEMIFKVLWLSSERKTKQETQISRMVLDCEAPGLVKS